MGCCKSTQADASPHPVVRRRLSLGDVGTGDDTAQYCKQDESDRQLLVQLTDKEVLEFAEETKMADRKWSVCSETDQEMNEKKTFGQKRVTLGGASLDVKQQRIGFACKKGLKPEAPNQDSFFVLRVESKFAIYGVFDGHGRKGHDVSNFVKDNLPKLLLRDPSALFGNPVKVLEVAFEKTQQLIIQATGMGKINAERSGTTCSVVVHDMEKHQLYVAHVGDSRIVLAKVDPEGRYLAQDLTIDHKPNLPEERKRIEARGGQVKLDRGLNHRVYVKNKRYPGLNMSRAMGDLVGFYDAGISPVPDVKKQQLGAAEDAPAAASANDGTGSAQPSVSSHELDPNADKFLLMCSDGVWEFLSSKNAVDIVAEFEPNQAMNAANALAKQSFDQWMAACQGQVVDDITALVIHFDES